MKDRIGFVSNSSASSFIVALAPTFKEPCPHCRRKSRFLELFHDGHCDYEANEIFSKGYESALHELETSDRGWQAMDGNMSARMRKLHRLGWEIIHLRISYHDHVAHDMLDDEVACGSAEILFTGD
jgi:glutaredoxin